MLNISMITLGCDKNTVDSEEMLGLLRQKGYNLVNDVEEADCLIINTCSFINDAKEESINTIIESAKLKEGRLKYLIAAGCLAERYKDEMVKELPEIDAFVGTTGFEDIVQVVERLEAGEEKVTLFKDINKTTEVDAPRIITERPYVEYLKIAEGCDKRCTYCAIPTFRGNFRSAPMERLIKTAKNLSDNGVRELILVAQETTMYGTDLYGEKSLHILLRKLSEIEGIEWIRILYCYPEEIYPELIEEMASNKKVLHYIDMPLQHTEDEMLRRMGRRVRNKDIYDIVSRLREKIPDIAIRTTFITGFPGETKEEHEDLLRTINEIEFDHVGVFTYSAEEGTAAASFPNQIDEETKEQYRNEIMELQQEISLDKNEAFVGHILDCIIEGYISDDDVYSARTYRDAPEVDGFVFVKSDSSLMSGSIVPVKIIGATEYDLVGELVEEE